MNAIRSLEILICYTIEVSSLPLKFTVGHRKQNINRLSLWGYQTDQYPEAESTAFQRSNFIEAIVCFQEADGKAYFYLDLLKREGLLMNVDGLVPWK